jgi:hypothetical protein
MPPICIHPANPHIFLYHDRPLVLIGASSSYMIVCSLTNDMSFKRPNWDTRIEFLDELQRLGLKKTRIWAGANGWNHVPPGNETGYAPAFFWDGDKWDLDQWNPHYFERMNLFLEECAERDIVVELTLFSQFYEDESWQQSPFHPALNRQGIGNASSEDFTRIADGRVYEYQKRYVRKLVEETNRHDNLYYEICNEPFHKDDRGAKWHAGLVDTIHEAESHLPNKHMVAVNGDSHSLLRGTGPQASILNVHYTYGDTWLGAFDLLDAYYCDNKPLGLDETMIPARNLGNPSNGRVEAWEFILGGGSVYDGLQHWWDHPDSLKHRTDLGRLVKFLKDFDLASMKRDDRLILGGVPNAGQYARAISDGKSQYAVYLHHSMMAGPHYEIQPNDHRQACLTVDLPAAQYRAEWVDPETLNVLASETFEHPSGLRTLLSPVYAVDISLCIRKESQ